MQLFYKLVLAVAIATGVVVAYDLFQAELEKAQAPPRIRFDPATKQFTFRKPDVSTRIVYAGMFNPGEPVKHIRNDWINMFEEEYSDRLAARQERSLSAEEKATFVAEMLDGVSKLLPKAERWLKRIETDAGIARANPDDVKARQDVVRQLDELKSWLEERELYITPLKPQATIADRLGVMQAFVAGLSELAASASPADQVRVAPLLVKVDRRWQGRWVLSANRPRFLSGKEVPDIIVGAKLELLALVEDDYAVRLDEALDGPDTYGDPTRKWRDAFVPALLAEGKYSFIEDRSRWDTTYMAPLLVNSYVIFYNKVLFDKAGVKAPPRTWPEFLAVCEKLKSKGITPLTADSFVYSWFWLNWMVFRSMGPEVWEQTIVGVPSDKPIDQRRSDPRWTDPRYVEALKQVRLLHKRGYFDEDFRASQWPAAQKEFVKGSAAMMICGTWLVQELSTYTDTVGDTDFKLDCFTFPTWLGGRKIDNQAAYADIAGMMVCRQGKATSHAIELVKYLSAKEHPDMVHKNALISCMADADFAEALAGIREDFIKAQKAGAIYSHVPEVYARRFNAQALRPLYQKFFLQRADAKGKDALSVEAFLKEMAKRTDEYIRKGGEGGY